MPMARQPSSTLRCPVRLAISAALTPRNDGCPCAYTAPLFGGSSPAMARMSVLLPEPLEPTTPMASPSLATSDTPRTAWTSLAAGCCCRASTRLSALAALPFAALFAAPYTRYTTCRSSMTTIGWFGVAAFDSFVCWLSVLGSATAITLLFLPENHESADEREYGPRDGRCPRCEPADQVERFVAV